VRRISAVVLAVAVLAGCSGGSHDAAGPTTAVEASGAAEALAFSAPLVDGGELDVRSLAGRPVVFWFWSPY